MAMAGTEIHKPSVPAWSDARAIEVQEAVDRIFGANAENLLSLEFSFTIADPCVEDVPLIGCSQGFTKLVGYAVHEIVGRNCRFLIDPVPGELIDPSTRRRCKEYCEAVGDGRQWIPPCDYPYAPAGSPCDELISMQTNMRKDGTLFNNLFFMKVFEMGSEMGEERPYIVALQSELGGGRDDLEAVAKNLDWLKMNMEKLKDDLSSTFFIECSMDRQLRDDESD